MEATTTIEVMGGLGNQLFQVCALLAYAWQNNRKPYLLHVPIQIGHRTKNYIASGTTVMASARTLMQQVFDRFPEQYVKNVYQEPAFHYQPIPADVTRLAGYFQSYKYFCNVENDLATFFNWPALTQMYREVLQGMVATTSSTQPVTNAVSMHFRLGDYRKNPAVHPIQSLDYYKRAMLYTQPSHVVWFTESDEQAHVEQQYITALKESFPDVNFLYLPANIWTDEEHMLLMAACDHHIMANSTFSYWAAYISTLTKSQHNKPRVCYPCQWFGPAMPVDSHDICPPEWVAL
jgi:hypothetical protein